MGSGSRWRQEELELRLEWGWTGAVLCCVVSGLWLWPVSRLVGAMIEVGVRAKVEVRVVVRRSGSEGDGQRVKARRSRSKSQDR